MCNTLDQGHEELRQCFSGACFDGQYIHLNVRKHLAGSLTLSLNFMDDSYTHNAAHRLELACKDAKEGKGMCIVPKCECLIQLDLQHIMTHFRYISAQYCERGKRVIFRVQPFF